MNRKRIILLAILALSIGAGVASLSAAPICTPVDVIRQRFVDRGAEAHIISDPRGVAVVTQAVKDNKAPAAEISDRYLFIAIAGVVVIYPIRDGQICAAGRDGLVPVTGQSAGDLIGRLREIEQAHSRLC
jgi:hypothetical protein